MVIPSKSQGFPSCQETHPKIWVFGQHNLWIHANRKSRKQSLVQNNRIQLHEKLTKWFYLAFAVNYDKVVQFFSYHNNIKYTYIFDIAFRNDVSLFVLGKHSFRVCYNVSTKDRTFFGLVERYYWSTENTSQWYYEDVQLSNTSWFIDKNVKRSQGKTYNTQKQHPGKYSQHRGLH